MNIDFYLIQKSKAKTYKKRALIHLDCFLFLVYQVCRKKSYKLFVCRKPKKFENHWRNQLRVLFFQPIRYAVIFDILQVYVNHCFQAARL